MQLPSTYSRSARRTPSRFGRHQGHSGLRGMLLFAFAEEPSEKPVLRVETGMHAANIPRISTDAKGRWLATASVDKTVRIWEVASGRLIQTLRVPIGAGDEGKLYAVALS